jgi:minor extracellular serine protease Vpr
MLVAFVLAHYALGPAEIDPTPLDPILSKFQTPNTPAYLKRLKSEKVHVALTGDMDYLSAEIPKHGGKIQTKTLSVVTAIMPADGVLALAESQKVNMIQQGFLASSGIIRPPVASVTPLVFDKPSVPLADRPYAVSTWPLAEMRSAGLTGKGVLVGVVEERAPDFRHPDFRSDDGKTRYAHCWNQWIESGKSPSQFSYGSDFSASDLQSILDSKNLRGFEFGSESDHSTGGSGALAGNGAAHGRYCGVAPEAELVNVVSIGPPPNVIDAVRYIFDAAEAAHKPSVVSISMALNNIQGLSEDGSDLSAIAISEMVQEKPGRIVVASSGNQGMATLHGHASIEDGHIPHYVLVPRQGLAKLLHTILSTRAGQVEMKIEAITAGSETEPFITSKWLPLKSLEPGHPVSLALVKDGVGVIVKIIPKWHPRNLQELCLELTPKEGLFAPVGIRISFRGKGDIDVQSHGFLEHQARTETDYVNPDSLSRTACPASGEAVFACGAYLDRDDKMNDGSSMRPLATGDVAFYTQPGGPFLNTYKPIALAPSHFPATCSIDSPTNLSKENSLKGQGYEIYGGTSASGPVLAGAIALYMQKHPAADYHEVEEAIKKACRGDQATGAVPNPRCGYGKLDLRKFLE